MTSTGDESEAEPTDPDNGWGALSSAFDEQPPPPGRSRTGVIAGVIVGVLVLGAAAGVAGTAFVLRSDDTSASASGPTSPPATGGRSATAKPTPTEEPPQEGPQASAYPAEEIHDLNRVCDEDVYYPQSPKRAGKAPHPIVLLTSDNPGLRSQDGTYYLDEGTSSKAEQTWAADHPKKVQLVACLDRVSTGSKIRTCKFDDPKPDTLTLFRSSWRLRVYEVATRRRLLDKRMTGDDQACPFVTLYGPDKKIYAKVSDRAAIRALRGFVNK
ncbi:hypothetical protein DFJ67_7966 [Asanoa ferruginea]|uniref:Uncharacterized protein n=1 Tax=Asanoa ferruginea TaxID=53367 RepID=A0A3D9ZXF4_9ACTN|nr:hypothetical protein [Asanoa ferruginea]REG01877.1 hypothetical protein DFJ67_7966 [Asanoa ferruginea]GIF50246.1 hypothetical protein Afe04nite_47850 [Asanoa ferruginea]